MKLLSVELIRGLNMDIEKQEYSDLIKKSTELKYKIKLLNKALADNATYTTRLVNYSVTSYRAWCK